MRQRSVVISRVGEYAGNTGWDYFTADSAASVNEISDQLHIDVFLRR